MKELILAQELAFANAVGAAVFDKDCYLTYTSPGPIGDGQIIEFECRPTTAYGRAVE